MRTELNGFKRPWKGGALFALLLGVLAPFAFAAEVIENTATLDFEIGTEPVSQQSNTVSVLTVPPPTPATVRFWQYSPNGSTDSILFGGGQYDPGDGSFVPLAATTTLTGQPIDLTQPVTVRETEVYHSGEPVFITLEDANRNIDPLVRETITLTLTNPLTGDTEVLQLLETGPDTGVFAGSLQSVSPEQATPNDGLISVGINHRLIVHYVDIFYPDDVVDDFVLVDPFGFVFDSQTGMPIDNVTVTVIDLATGRPATVFGDDGFSDYPSTNVTGGTVTDSSGTIYQLPPGGFRFPFMYPGNYRFVVTPPPDYTMPSERTPEELDADPDTTNYEIVAGSYGDRFVVLPGPALHIDIPIDPPANPFQTLSLSKMASVAEASAGDFLQYTLTITNLDPDNEAQNVTMTDVLPTGMRYQSGSLNIGGATGTDPDISDDGRTLSFAVGNLPAAGTVSVSYVTQIVARRAQREAINIAQALADGGIRSNEARAAIRIREPLMSGAFTIIGEVGCGAPLPVAPTPVAPSCRQVPAPVANEPSQTFTVQANFDSGRATLKAAGERDLDALAAQLAGRDIVRIELIGHTDNQRVGNPRTLRLFGDNYGLSRARAQTVGDYLAGKLGLTPDQVTASGKGPDDPVASNATSAGMAKNRRTEVRVFERVASGAKTTEVCDGPVTTQPAPTANSGRKEGRWTGLPNVRVLLDNGTYTTTDADGRYHFEGVRPGTHVVQVDLDSLPPGYRMVPGIQNTRYAGRSFSKFVDVRGGGLWRADFEACSAGSDVGVRIDSALASSGAAESLSHKVTVDGGDVAVSDVKVTVMLDERTAYTPGSAKLDGKPTDDPQVNGNILTFRLGDPGARWKRVIEFNGTPAVGEAGTSQYTLQANFDSGRATLKPAGQADINRLIAELSGTEIERIELIGHTDSQRVGNPRTLELFGDNYGLSRARAQAVGDALARGLGLSPSQISATGRGPDQPVASNDTPAGMAKNRRTEVIVYRRQAGVAGTCGADGYSQKAVASFVSPEKKTQRTPPASNTIDCPEAAGAVTRGASERTAQAVDGQPAAIVPTEVKKRTRIRAEIEDSVTAAGGGIDWLGRATEPGVAWLYPQAGKPPRHSATRIVIQHGLKQSVKLTRNGEPVSPLNYDGMKSDPARGIAITSWRGVDLSDGENRFEAQILNVVNGEVVQTLNQLVHFGGSPVRAEFLPDESVLIADGITPPVIAVRLLDGDGNPVRNGMYGTFRLSSPYEAFQTVDEQQRRALAGRDRIDPTWQVEGENGVAYIELMPTTESGTAVVSFNFEEVNGNYRRGAKRSRRQDVRAWLEAPPRDWVLVGFVDGTVGYNTLSENATNLPPDVEDEVYTDGQASVYAKGRVLGKWLLTIAYDSDKPSEIDRRGSLLSTIDPNEYYTLYGDGTGQRYDAASQGKLYLKLERGQFYALFGDYDTGLTVTQLSRYSRTLNGIKTEYGGNSIEVNAFAAETVQSTARDEIRGNGTSGLYRLSSAPIVINSEKIRLETRDRYRSNLVVESRSLTRHIDYDIDYGNATLFFKQPIQSRDTDFNPIFIVVDYETFGAGEPETNAGGRVGVKLFGDRLQFGISGVAERQLNGEGDLAGADLKLRVGQLSELRLEAASSEGVAAGTATEGDAWLAEYEHRGDIVSGLLYTRRQESGFGLNQQNLSESGMEKTGVDGQVHLTENFSLLGQAFRQEAIATEATREVASGGVQFATDSTRLRAGYQSAEDTSPTGETFASEQLTLGAGQSFFGRRLDLLANADIGLSDQNANADFPSRYQAGGSFALTPNARVIVMQEYTDGAAFDTSMTRVGMEVTPWAGARLSSTLNQQEISEYGPRTFGQFGLQQTLLLGERWGADLSVDTSRTFKETGTVPFVPNPNEPSAVTGGSMTEDYVALSGGLTYRSGLWSWTGRAESRTGSATDRFGLTTSWLRQADAGVAVAANLQAFQEDRVTGTKGTFGTAGLALAMRPLGWNWSILNRLEFKFDQIDQGTGAADGVGGALFGNNTLAVTGNAKSRRLVNNFALNRVSEEWTEEDRHGNLLQLSQRNQWSLYYGSKYSLDEYNGVDYVGYTDLIGIEVRHDLTRHWDVGFQASSLNSWSNNTHDYSAGPSLGWSPAVNSWISLGYNVVGFYDRDFEAARYTAQGPYLKVRIKFDQNTRLFEDRQDPRAMDWDEYAHGSAPVDSPQLAAKAAEPAPNPVVAPPVAAAEPKSTPTAVVAPAPAPTPELFQVGALSAKSMAEANRVVDALKARGRDSRIEEVTVDGQTAYWVMVVPLTPAPEVEQVASILRKELGGIEPWIAPVGDPRPSPELLGVAAGAAGVATGVAAGAANTAGVAASAPNDFTGTRYGVSPFSMTTGWDAKNYAAGLEAHGYPATVQEVVVDGVKWFRVVISGFDSVAQATPLLDHLKKRFPGSKPWVVPTGNLALTESP